LLYTVDGLVVVPTTLVESTTEAGLYTLTVPAFTVGKVLKLKTWNTLLMCNAIKLSGALYESNLATVTAV